VEEIQFSRYCPCGLAAIFNNRYKKFSHRFFGVEKNNFEIDFFL